MNPQIVLVTGTNIGGAERITLLFAKILKQAGLDVYLVLYQNASQFELKALIPDDIPYEVVHCRIRYLSFHLVKVLRRLKPQLVYVTLYHVVLQTALATWMLHKPYVFVFRDSNTPSRHPRWQVWLGSLLFRKCDALIAQTEEMRRQMIEAYKAKPERVVTIYNPIDKALIAERIKEKQEMDHSYCNYVAIGRVAEQKDCLMLVRAFTKVVEQQPMSRLYFVGSYEATNAYKQQVEQLVAANNLQDKVYFEGMQANPYKYAEAVDVYVLSSEFEGLPNAMLEAMYLGKPVVATRCIPFVAQVVKEGVNGYTTAVGDHEDFARKMLLAPKLKGIEKFVDAIGSEEKVVSLFKSLLP